ncbi:Mitochondrial copper homeostasis protein [Endocarpon pusillum]|uniref:Cytochrome c oxidase-assembly factor COX23, mitochondrial n=1 Tax=Endocarpon pusillum TaxID=364733 RepID=A0A8H7DZU5_9EURO|nr:Mitochondrial copper homeostasis protein [Endocarpon pusillum]
MSTSTSEEKKEDTTAEREPDAWRKVENQFTSKRNSEYFDPCQEFASKSIRCLHRNGGDREMCIDYFQAYRDCKKEWTLRRREAMHTAGGSWILK